MLSFSMTTPKEFLLDMIAQEKEQYSAYCQLCATYRTKADPIVLARHQGKLEVLQSLICERTIVGDV
jgi:hypothetical protein